MDGNNTLTTVCSPCRAEIKATDFGLSIFFKPGERFNELVGSPYYVRIFSSVPVYPVLMHVVCADIVLLVIGGTSVLSSLMSSNVYGILRSNIYIVVIL